MALDKELDTFRNNLSHLLAQPGKFVLIHGDAVAGVWDTYQQAIEEGYARLNFRHSS